MGKLRDAVLAYLRHGFVHQRFNLAYRAFSGHVVIQLFEIGIAPEQPSFELCLEVQKRSGTSFANTQQVAARGELQNTQPRSGSARQPRPRHIADRIASPASDRAGEPTSL